MRKISSFYCVAYFIKIELITTKGIDNIVRNYIYTSRNNFIINYIRKFEVLICFPGEPVKESGPLDLPSIKWKACRKISSFRCKRHINQCNGRPKLLSSNLITPPTRPVLTGVPSQRIAFKELLLLVSVKKVIRLQCK